MATLTNIPINARSMNGLITISDGTTVLENGNITTTGDLDVGMLNANNFTANNVIVDYMQILRDSNPVVNATLGFTVDVGLLVQNMIFQDVTRLFQIWNDTANSAILQINTGNADVVINADGLDLNSQIAYLTATQTIYLIATNNIHLRSNNIDLSGNIITLSNATVSFPSSTVSFNSFLPTSSLTPSADNQLITRIYADSRYGQLASANAWTSTNTFNSFLPTSSVTPSADNQLITRIYADSRYGQLASANAWTGNTNTFNSFLPTSTIATTTGGTQFITRAIGDGRFGQLAVTNTWDLNNIFTRGILPRTSLTDTNIQLSSNSMVNRQATSLNNVGIGLNTLVGDTLSTYYSTITGSQNIGIGNSALQQLCSGSNNIGIGYQAMQLSVLERGIGVSTQRNIAIGSFSQKTCGYSTDNITLGYNSLPNNAYGNGNVVIASNGGGGISNKNGCVIIGSNSCPTASENAIISIGESAMGASTGSTLACIAIGQQALFNCRTSGCLAIGYQSLFNLTTGYDNQGIGYTAGAGCVTGIFNQFIGRGTNTTKSDVINSVCVGYNARTVADYEFVIGGDAGGYPALTLPEKVKKNVNKNIGAVATHTIPWRSPENVIVDSATTTQINLPTAAETTDIHIGAVFNIIRTNAATSNILIVAYSAEKISYLDTTTVSFTLNSWERSISLVCVDKTASGINWTICNYAARVSLANDANKLQTITDSTNVNYPVAFTTINPVGTYSAVYANASLTYNPSTSLLTVPNLTIQNKTTIVSNQEYTTGTTINLTFTSNENIVLSAATLTTLNLPLIAGSQNIGAKFYIYRSIQTTNSLLLNAATGQSIDYLRSDGVYVSIPSGGSFPIYFNDPKAEIICVSTTKWLILSRTLSVASQTVSISTNLVPATTLYSIPFGVSGGASNTTYTSLVNDTGLTFNTATTTLNSTNITTGAVNISNKVSLSTNQNAVSNPTLSFGTAETVLLTDAATTDIVLPVPATANLGTKFVITRKVSGLDITINPPALQTVGYISSLDGTYNTSLTYRFSKFMSSITAVCIATPATSSNTWLLIEGSVPKIPMDFQPNRTIELLSSATVLPSLPTLYGVYYFASGAGATTITLPLITADIIGCQLNFRRITNTTSTLVIKTPSGSAQLIVQRGSITETAAFTNYTFLSTAQFEGTLIALSTTRWAVSP
jgi:hypothetical protein